MRRHRQLIRVEGETVPAIRRVFTTSWVVWVRQYSNTQFVVITLFVRGREFEVYSGGILTLIHLQETETKATECTNIQFLCLKVRNKERSNCRVSPSVV